MRLSSTAIELNGTMAQKLISDSIDVAKSKFEAKSTIIKDANDLSTQDKLGAFDQATSQYFLDILTCVCISGVVILLLNGKA